MDRVPASESDKFVFSEAARNPSGSNEIVNTFLNLKIKDVIAILKKPDEIPIYR